LTAQVEGTGGARRRLLARNAAINLGGQLTTLAIAAVAITIIARELDPERFGFLLVAWAVVGYFSVFDLGLGRAVTWAIADVLGAGRNRESAAILWPVVGTTALLGAVFGLATIVAAPVLSDDVLGLPSALQGEGQPALRILGASLPFVLSAPSLRGALEANQRFDVTVAIRVPTAAVTYLGAAFTVLWISDDLAVIALVLLIGRAFVWTVNLAACLIVLPELRALRTVRPRRLLRLLGFGGWVTLSNTLFAAPSVLDRTIIATLTGTREVAFYATPQEATTRVLVVPGSIVQVLFPAMVTTFSGNERATGLYATTAKAVCVVLFLIAVPLVIAAEPLLDVWLGPVYADESAFVLVFLTIATFFNGLAYLPHTALQAAGLPRLGTYVYATSIGAYVAALFLVVPEFGIAGAAVAAGGRTAAEFLALTVLADRRTPIGAVAVTAQQGGVIAGAILILLGVMPATASIPIGIAALVAYGVYGREALVRIAGALRPTRAAAFRDGPAGGAD
jgi:O-antigen/teichoic acid export membrane protein